MNDIGLNYDLIHMGQQNTRHAECGNSYQRPPSAFQHIPNNPENLRGGLFRASTDKLSIYTVEHKDPSVLWRLSSDAVFTLWWHSLGEASGYICFRTGVSDGNVVRVNKRHWRKLEYPELYYTQESIERGPIALLRNISHLFIAQ